MLGTAIACKVGAVVSHTICAAGDEKQKMIKVLLALFSVGQTRKLAERVRRIPVFQNTAAEAALRMFDDLTDTTFVPSAAQSASPRVEHQDAPQAHIFSDDGVEEVSQEEAGASNDLHGEQQPSEIPWLDVVKTVSQALPDMVQSLNVLTSQVPSTLQQLMSVSSQAFRIASGDNSNIENSPSKLQAATTTPSKPTELSPLVVVHINNK